MKKIHHKSDLRLVAMNFLRILALLSLFVVTSGCIINPIYLPGKYNILGVANDGFGIALAPSRFNELGGKESKEFAAFIQEVATKEKLCPDRTQVTDVQGLWGYMAISVQCVSN
jgi:hypothetical protein